MGTDRRQGLDQCGGVGRRHDPVAPAADGGKLNPTGRVDRHIAARDSSPEDRP